MSRARAKAVALARRRPDPLPWFPWLLLFGLLMAGAAMGQTPTTPQTGPTATPGAGTPLAQPTTPDTPGGTTHNGVAVPVPDRDPGMVRAVPAPMPNSMAIIPPPGSPGGNPAVVPK